MGERKGHVNPGLKLYLAFVSADGFAVLQLRIPGEKDPSILRDFFYE